MSTYKVYLKSGKVPLLKYEIKYRVFYLKNARGLHFLNF